MSKQGCNLHYDWQYQYFETQIRTVAAKVDPCMCANQKVLWECNDLSYLCLSTCECVCACMRAYVRVRVRACVYACLRVYAYYYQYSRAVVPVVASQTPYTINDGNALASED